MDGLGEWVGGWVGTLELSMATPDVISSVSEHT